MALRLTSFNVRDLFNVGSCLTNSMLVSALILLS